MKEKMKDYVNLYAVRLYVEKNGESIVSYGAPFTAPDDEAAITAVRDTITDHIKTGIIDKCHLKHHVIYRIGRYYFMKQNPIAVSKIGARRVFDCCNFICDNEQKEDSFLNA